MLEKYLKIRKSTEFICEELRPEDSVVQPMNDISPPKWHLAHTTWFFEKFILEKFFKNYTIFHADYNFLFNSYYDNIGDRIPRNKRGTITRPGLDEVLKYRKYVDKHMEELLVHASLDELLPLLNIGIQHEEQHQELLLCDIKYILGNNPTYPPYKSNFYSVNNQNTIINEGSFIEVPEGVYEIGYVGNGFCFDNELGRHKVYLHSYKVCDVLVTNKEYLDFINDGGYENFNYWLADGLEWVKQNNISNPLYWKKMGKSWCIYDYNGLTELSMTSCVCHVSFYEADAFARWKGYRLLTEFEWEVCSSKIKYGKRWEWTNSAYLPYPFFKKEAGAIGEYNGKFMINQMVLRGGSIASPQGHVRPTYRNFFPPDKQWQFSGIRLGLSIGQK